MTSIRNGMLIFPILKDMNKADGILVKNEGIRKGFLQNDIDLDVMEFTTAGVFNQTERIYSFSANRYLRIYQYHFSVWDRISDYVAAKKYDFIWFRIPVINRAIRQFVESVKSKRPQCKMVIEYGAYPFANELRPLKKSIYLLNKHHEKKVHAVADFIVTYSGQKDVDGVTNIPIDNGIDLDSVPMIVQNDKGIPPINFISVSSLKKWHALERFIAGIANYVHNRIGVPVHFDIVGDGPEYQKLLSLVNGHGLQERVTFHGFKTGVELDRIYQKNHVAVGTLGFHRIGIAKSSSLKNREYFARGLPVVLSTPDEDMPDNLPFVKYVSPGENPLNIEELVEFANRVHSTPGVHKLIRSYAEEKLSWRSKTKTVLDYLNAGMDRELIHRREQLMAVQSKSEKFGEKN